MLKRHALRLKQQPYRDPGGGWYAGGSTGPGEFPWPPSHRMLRTVVRLTIALATCAVLAGEDAGRQIAVTMERALVLTQWRCVKEPHFFTLRA
jgi:hypothetical protein